MKIINPYRFGGADSLLTGLVSWWSLDETSGTRADSHGSHDLTDNNTVTSIAGIQSNAAVFVAANDESLSLAHHADFIIGSSDFTIAAWLYVTASTESNSGYVTKTSNSFGLGGWALRGSSGAGNVQFAVRNAANTATATTNTISLGTDTWAFLIAEHDSGSEEVRCSVDLGTPQTAAIAGGALATGSDPLRIGSNGAPNYLDGRVDEVAIWRRLLTSDEKTALYNSGSGMAYPG